MGATSHLKVCSTSCKQPPDECRKKTVKKRRRRDGNNVAQTLEEWRAINNQLNVVRKVPVKGSKRGCMRGKGGPENGGCKYRGVRQRAWGNWVAEIRVPKGNKRLWLGTFSTSKEAAESYDEAAKAMYGASATLNFPNNNTSISQEKKDIEAACMGNNLDKFDQDLLECLSMDENDDFDVCMRLATSTTERFRDDKKMPDNYLQQILSINEPETMLSVDELLGEIEYGPPSDVTPLT